MTEIINPKQWFIVPDSKCRGDDGVAYYNVEARFADHGSVDVEASRKARHTVHRLVPQLHMRVKKNIFGQPAYKNSTSVVFRFDKGADETRIDGTVMGPTGTMVPNRVGKPGLSKPDFDRAIALIMRCFDAWEHYQGFRQAPVWPLEEEAVKIIEARPRSARVVVDRDGNLVEFDPIDDDEEEEHDPDGELPEHVPMPVQRPKTGRKTKAVAA